MGNLRQKAIGLLTGAMLVLLFLSYFVWQSGGQARVGELEVIFFDVGQGDAILINTPYDQQILIDGGPDNTVVQKLGEYMSFFDRDLDIVVLTHPHADHVTGLVDVVKRYDLGEVWATGALHTSGDYLAWLDAIKETAAPLRLITRPERLSLMPPDGVEGEPVVLEIFYPFLSLKDQKFEDLNDSSLVIRLVYGESEFLFTGDAGFKIEDELLAAGIELSSDVLKVGHHGSAYSTGETFLQTVDPDYAVIQSGAGNSYGHPHRRTLKLLQKYGVKILRNDLLGDVVLASDGQTVKQK